MSSGTLTVSPHVRGLSPRVRKDPDVERGDCWDLVAAAQGGDREAFGELYRRYREPVFRFVLFRVASKPTAEDLTAETFARALTRIGSIEYMGRDVGAWFITIARNLIFDMVKSSRYRLESTTAVVLDSAAWPESVNMRKLGESSSVRRAVLFSSDIEIDPAQTATDEVFGAQLRADIEACMGQMTRGQREVLTYRFYLGYSVAETAQAMGQNDGAVKALQHRAVGRLKQLLPQRSLDQ